MVGDPATTAPAVRVDHLTTYRFDRPVRLSVHTLRLRPADRSPSTVDHVLESPVGTTLAWQRSGDDEWTGRLDVRGRVTSLELASSFTTAVPTLDPLARQCGPKRPSRSEDSKLDASDGPSAPMPPTFTAASEAARSVAARITHVEDHDEIARPVEEIVASGFGSCRDSSMVLLHDLVQIGLTARFVAGYLIRLTDHEDLVPGPWPAVVPAAEDSVAYHAWVEVMIDGMGWVAFDSTTGRPGGGGHVPVASGRGPSETPPVEGSTEPAAVTLTTDHHVRRL